MRGEGGVAGEGRVVGVLTLTKMLHKCCTLLGSLLAHITRMSESCLACMHYICSKLKFGHVRIICATW